MGYIIPAFFSVYLERGRFHPRSDLYIVRNTYYVNEKILSNMIFLSQRRIS